jgi:murein DD-endopeptidase MepM/ murein hydrolase activator NlpD
MKAEFQRYWARVFSERHILIRGTAKVRHLRIPAWAPAIGVVCAAASAVALVHAGSVYFEGRSLLSFLKAEAVLRQAEMEDTVDSNADLREHVARLEQRLAAANRQLSEAQGRLHQAAAQNSELRGHLYTAELKLAGLEEQRDDAQDRLLAAEEAFASKSAELDDLSAAVETAARHGDTQRTVLAGRLKLVEAEKEEAAKHVAEMKHAVAAAEKRAQLAVTDRDRMKKQLAEVEKSVAHGGVALAAAAKAPEAAKTVEPGSAGGWSEIESLLSSVGVDVAALAAKFNVAPTGQGGPFYAFDPRAKAGAGQVPMENLKRLLVSLPLAEPLDAKYRLESRFGTRADPLNHKKAMHSGLDFSAPYRSPVYSTAPGVVTYAGAKGEYGREVEIDHGHGIVTRYAHMHRIMVVKGQRVSAHQQVGQLGSTGRSTGPHLHYEILVNGVAQDPERFLDAGRNAIHAVSAKK